MSATINLQNTRAEDRLVFLTTLIHAADLAGSTKPWPICKEWASRVLREFFIQVCGAIVHFSGCVTVTGLAWFGLI